MKAFSERTTKAWRSAAVAFSPNMFFTSVVTASSMPSAASFRTVASSPASPAAAMSAASLSIMKEEAHGLATFSAFSSAAAFLATARFAASPVARLCAFS